MKGCFSAPVLPFSFSTSVLRRFSFDCVWELATTHTGMVVLDFAVILVARYVRSPWRHVPPGPWGFPIIGNAAKLQDKTWLFSQHCKEKYRVFSNSTDSVLVLTISKRI